MSLKKKKSGTRRKSSFAYSAVRRMGGLGTIRATNGGRQDCHASPAMTSAAPAKADKEAR